MRAIKFRGFSKKEVVPFSQERQWVVGNLLTEEGFAAIHNGKFPVEVIPDSVGQYIGIIDTSTPPKEIYDGDIIDSKSGIRHLVKYDDDSAAFLAYKLPLNEFDNGCHIKNDWVVKFEKKVIGNVFDNHELIKKEE